MRRVAVLDVVSLFLLVVLGFVLNMMGVRLWSVPFWTVMVIAGVYGAIQLVIGIGRKTEEDYEG